MIPRDSELYLGDVSPEKEDGEPQQPVCSAEVVGDQHMAQLNSAAALKACEHFPVAPAGPGGASFPGERTPSPTPWGHSWRLDWVFRLQVLLSLALSGQKQARHREGEGQFRKRSGPSAL